MVTLRSLSNCYIILCYQNVQLVCYVCWLSLQAYCFLMWFAISFYCQCSFKEDYILLWECCFSEAHSSRIVLFFFLLIPHEFYWSGIYFYINFSAWEFQQWKFRHCSHIWFGSGASFSHWRLFFIQNPGMHKLNCHYPICLLWTRDLVICTLVGLKTKVPNTSERIWSSNSLGTIIMTQLVELTAQTLSSVFTYW